MARRAYHVRTENKFIVLLDMHKVDAVRAGAYIGVGVRCRTDFM